MNVLSTAPLIAALCIGALCAGCGSDNGLGGVNVVFGDGGAAADGSLDGGAADIQSVDVMLDSTAEAANEPDAGAGDAVDEISDACTQGAVFNGPCGPQGTCCPGLVCTTAGDRPVCIYTP